MRRLLEVRTELETYPTTQAADPKLDLRARALVRPKNLSLPLWDDRHCRRLRPGRGRLRVGTRADRVHRADLAADYVAGNHQFYAAIELAAGNGLVGSNRFTLAQAASQRVVQVHAVIDQVITHGGGALFREHLVVLFRSRAVGVTFDFQAQIGIGKHDSGDPG